MQKKVIVIGAGIGGLANACFLARDGYKVTVIEKNALPGGRINLLEKSGFKFDMGPSWYMMPDVFEQFFAQFGRKVSDYYQLIKLAPSYRVYFDNQIFYDISPDLEVNVNLFESLETGAGEQLRKYIAASKYKYETALGKFIYKSYRSPFDFINREVILNGPRMKLFKSYHAYVAKFFQHPHLQKLAEWMITFLGSSPYNAPAMYSLISYADYGLGIYYPQGGMYKVVEGFVKLATELGVEFLYNASVEKIEVSSGEAQAVIGKFGRISADIVVANADYHHVETQLLEKLWQSYPESYWQKKLLSPSSLLFYLGLNKKLNTKLLHHTLFFLGDWQTGFQELFEQPQWPEELLYYASITSKTDKSVAPEGQENLFLLMPVAPGLQDSPELQEHYYQKMLRNLEEVTGEAILNHVIVKETFSIVDFSNVYNAYKGNAFGLAHTLGQSAIFRPKNWSRKVKNLFYVGCMTNPGIGVPMGLASAQIVAKEIQQQFV